MKRSPVDDAQHGNTSYSVIWSLHLSVINILIPRDTTTKEETNVESYFVWIIDSINRILSLAQYVFREILLWFIQISWRFVFKVQILVKSFKLQIANSVSSSVFRLVPSSPHIFNLFNEWRWEIWGGTPAKCRHPPESKRLRVFSSPILGGKDTSSAQLEKVAFTLFGSGINDDLMQKDFQLSKKEVKYLKAKFGPKV